MRSFLKLDRFFLLGWLLLCFVVGRGVSAAAEPVPMLWEIRGETKRSWLFGTIHLPNPEVTRFPESVTRALNGSDHFYAELDFVELNAPENAGLMMLPPGQHLRSILPPELAQRTQAVLGAINPFLSLDTMGTLRVWAIAASLPILREQLRYPGEPVVDVALFRQARAAGLRTGGLESIAEQVQIFEMLSLGAQIRLLDETVTLMEREAAGESSMTQEMIRWYLEGNADGFSELMERFTVGESWSEDPEMKQFVEALIDGRNRTLAARIDAKLRAEPDSGIFFAVGAGHFSGETGIQRLLRERGWVVERITASPHSQPAK